MALAPLSVHAADAPTEQHIFDFGNKAAAPAGEARAAADKALRERFAREFADATAGGRAALARQLLQTARESKDDAAGRYAAYREALELGILAGDFGITNDAMNSLVRDFEVDSLAERFDGLARFLGVTETGPAARAAIDAAIKLTDEAILVGRYDAALKSAALAETGGRKANDPNLAKSTGEKLVNVTMLQKEAANVAPALKTLAKSPDDQDANAAAGRFYCLWRGDWQQGLPMLAKGSDAPLRALAQEEIAGAADAPMQLAIANAWWDLAAKLDGPPKAFAMDHASDLYTHNLANLEGVNKTMAQKRIADAPTHLPFPRPADAVTVAIGNGSKITTIQIVADDFVAELYVNGKPVASGQRKLQGEIFGAQHETVHADLKPGDWIVFQAVNNQLRWGGAYYFAAAGQTDAGELAFVSETRSGKWSACTDLKEVGRFVAERDYFTDQKSQLVQRPWDRGNQLIAKAAPGWNGEAVWGDPGAKSVWIKYVVPEK